MKLLLIMLFCICTFIIAFAIYEDYEYSAKPVQYKIYTCFPKLKNTGNKFSSITLFERYFPII